MFWGVVSRLCSRVVSRVDASPTQGQVNAPQTKAQANLSQKEEALQRLEVRAKPAMEGCAPFRHLAADRLQVLVSVETAA